MQISGGESKTKAHMLTFLKKKKSPDFKTAYLRNDKYCTTRGAFTFRSSTKAFQTYKMRLHTRNSKLPMSFLNPSITGFVTLWTSTWRSTFTQCTRTTKREAVRSILPVYSQDYGVHSYGSQRKA